MKRAERGIKTRSNERPPPCPIRGMARMGIDEPQDYISRLIHSADLLNDNDLERMTRLPQ